MLLCDLIREDVELGFTMPGLDDGEVSILYP